MTATATTPSARTRGRSRAVVELPAPATSSPALDTLTGADPTRAVTSGVPVQMPVDALRLHPANPAHRHDEAFEGLAELIRAQGGIREALLVRPHPTETGVYEVLSGARRMAAAQLLGMILVPVRIEHLDDAAALLEVLAGNLERLDFTDSEQSVLVQDALDLGLTEETLAEQLGRGREWIARRRAIAALPPAARKVVDVAATPDVDLVRAAAAAEFADDPEEFANLTESIADADFDHVLQEARDAREEAQARQAKVDELLAEHPNLLILDDQPDTWGTGATTEHLVDLAGEAGGKAITPKDHEECPGHAAFVDVYRAWSGDDRSAKAEVRWYCTTWKTSGHFNRHASSSSGATSGPMTDEQKAERRHLVETNKAADAAQVVRRAWITEFLGRDKMPPDAIVYVEQMLTLGYRSDLNEALAVELSPEKIRTRADRALHRLVALAIAHVEQYMPRDYWRNTYNVVRTAAHLTALAAWGYPLAPHEQDYVDAAKKAGS